MFRNSSPCTTTELARPDVERRNFVVEHHTQPHSSPTIAPIYFRTPQVEVVAVLASAMGTLDVAAGVICGDATTAPGWRLMGVVEMALALLFLFWFMKKGRAFLSAAQWKPALNVAQRRMYTALDADGDGSVGDTVGCTALSIAHTGRLNERTNDE